MIGIVTRLWAVQVRYCGSVAGTSKRFSSSPKF
jgi:hypothetical protein